MRRFPLIVLLGVAFGAGMVLTWSLVHRSATSQTIASTPAAAGSRKALYWFDPMKPQQHFDKPGKSPFMDMQLVPKYADAGDDDPGTVRIDARQVQNLGVRTAVATRGSVQSNVRATGTIGLDEREVSVVQSRVPGIVEQLQVRTALAPVTKGQPLLTLIAPDWTAAQEEYLALRRASSPDLVAVRDAARQRLLLLGMSDAQIRAVERRGQAQTRITIVSPRAGIIGELAVRDGATVAAGALLMRINGIDTVWLNAAIPEADIGRLQPGAAARVDLPAFKGITFNGIVEALLPEVDATTRTLVARVVLPNPDHRLAPGMFARVEIASTPAATLDVVIPSEAVIATGLRQVVIVDVGAGRFRAQEVRVGDEGGGRTAILEGIHDGDRVVVSSQFLIDSEASLTGTLARLGADDQNAAATKAVQP